MRLLYRYWSQQEGNYTEHLLLYKEGYRGYLCMSPNVAPSGTLFSSADMERNSEFKPCTDDENELIKGILGMVDEWWKHAEEDYIKHGLQLLQLNSMTVKQIVEMFEDLYYVTANIYQ